MLRISKRTFPLLSQLLTLCAVLTLLGVIVKSQESASTPALELGVEVSGAGARPHVFPALSHGGAGTSVKRIAGWTPAPGESPVRQLSFQVEREADVVKINLKVRLENDKEIPVASYALHEGESATANDLTKYGVEPVTLKIVRYAPRRPAPPPEVEPSVENRTNSLEIVGVKKSAHSPRSYMITLRNLSSKNVIAVDLFQPLWHGGYETISNGSHSRPAMAGGEAKDFNFNLSAGGTRETPVGEVRNPDPSPPRIVVRAVVFDDWSYEGDAETAARIEINHRAQNFQRALSRAFTQDAGEQNF